MVTITGAGSNWTSTGTLAMTNGSFSLLDGGAASFASATIGSAPQTANLLVSGANSIFTTTGDLTVGNGTGTGVITLADAAHLAVGGTFTLAGVAGSTGVLNIGGAEGQAADAAGFYDAPTLAFGAGTGRLNFNHTETNYAFATAMSGAGTVNQVAGVTNLTGDSSAFTGTTNVSGGTLKVNGTLGNASAGLNVLNGGTLGGAGTIGGNVSVANGGILAPGNSPGTLTINGNLALSAGSVLNFEFGQANTPGGALNDLVNVGGDLTLDGTINVTQSAGGTFGPGIYRVFNYGGALTDNGLALGTLPGGQTVQVQTSVAGQVNLVNTTGLAFSFWDGDAGPKGNNVINGGSGSWHLAGTDANWTDAGGAANDAWSDGTTAIFAGAAGTVAVDNTLGNVTASGMQFATDGYVLTGSPLTLVGTQAAIQVGDGSAAGAGYTATISAALSGSSQLVKTDLGTLVLTGANTYTGGTLISGGVLSVANDSFLGDAAGAITLDGGTLQLTGANSVNQHTLHSGRKRRRHRRHQRRDPRRPEQCADRQRRADQARCRLICPQRRQHLHRRHDDPRGYAAGRQSQRHHRLDRGRRGRQRHADLLPIERLYLCRIDHRHRQSCRDRHGRGHADGQQQLCRHDARRGHGRRTAHRRGRHHHLGRRHGPESLHADRRRREHGLQHGLHQQSESGRLPARPW